MLIVKFELNIPPLIRNW